MTMNNNSAPNLNNLFQNAQDEGLLSQTSMQALNVIDIGAQIQAGLGINVDDVTASEVVLVTIMPDDSGSIRFSGNTQAVRGGHNSVLDALIDSPQQDNILIHTRYLNGFVLFPYLPLSQAVRIDTKNYNPNLGTPLYDQTLVLLGTVLAKSQEFADNGVPVRTITDGSDEGSRRANAKDVAAVIKDMLKSENHIIAGMGIDNEYTDFKQVFQSMGIRDEWILTPGNSESEIRQAFQIFSQSVIQVSQTANNFYQSFLGGFGTP